MFGYIYKMTNLVNGKIYIGQHRHHCFDDYYKGSGVRVNDAIKHYGWDNFKVELIEECLSKQELDEREKYWIATLDARNPDVGYNLSEGGERGFMLTEESYKKIVETRRRNGTISGWKQSEESIKQRQETMKAKYGHLHTKGMSGKHHSEKTKLKMSLAQKGRHHTEEQNQRTSELTKLAMQKPEVRQKITDGLKKKWQDPEFRKKMSLRRKKRQT